MEVTLRIFFSFFGLIIGFTSAEWNPFHGSDAIFGGIPTIPDTDTNGKCQIYKVSMTQHFFEQYIEYKESIPSLKELTLCFWTKFYNHSNDHPIFAYGDLKQPREIYSWVSNSDESSFFSMAIAGQTFYRLNYPLRLRKWYHVCQSWNGKTGEWQIWVNAERVGRGFHNRLVGHVIPRGGAAISGQELAKNEQKESVGLQGEITMVQLYGVALTAGKAHKDHKHHHAHKYDHNGVPITTPAPTTPNPRPALPTHPLLTGGQINPNVRLNIAGVQNQPSVQPQIIQGQNYNAQYLNGQFVGGAVTQQLQGQAQQQQQQQLQQLSQSQSFFPEQNVLEDLGSFSKQTLSIGNTQLLANGVEHPSSYNHLQDAQRLFKRENTNKTKSALKKRELYLTSDAIFYDDGGLAAIGENQPVLHQQKQNDEREPAEAETKAVMNICTGCDEEPFEKAIIFGWRTVQKKLYGATYAPAIAQCKVF